MNDPGTNATLVRRVRTFADDMRRAKHGDATPTQMLPRPVVGDLQPPVVAPSTPQPPPQGQPFAQPVEISRLLDGQKNLDVHTTEDQDAQEGTIIRDARSKRWTLRKALGNSLNAWVEEQKDTISQITDKKEPVPRVPPVATRATVVQAARQKSALAPKDDRKAMVEKLRTFARDAERLTGKSYTLIHKPRAGATTPQWSYVEENRLTSPSSVPQAPGAGVPSIKQARPTIRPSQDISRKIPQNLPIRPTPKSAAAPLKSLEKDVAPLADQSLPEQAFVTQSKPATAPPPMKTGPFAYGLADVAPVATREPGAAVQVTEAAPPPAPPTPPTPPKPEAADMREEAVKRLLAVRRQKEASAEPSRDIAFEQPTFETQKTASFRTYRDDAIRDVEQNKRSIPHIAAAEAVRNARKAPRFAAQERAVLSVRPFAIAGIVIIALIVVGGFGFFWFARQGTLEDTTIVRVPTFMAIDAQKAVSFSENRATLLDTLTAEVRTAQAGITQIYPTAADEQNAEAEGRAVPTSGFMRVLDPRAPGSFVRNLEEEMMFGTHSSTDGTHPFFILKAKQFDTAFAGMIDWEQNISADLTPLYGSPVERTYDATSRTTDQATVAHFVDDTINNTDVRILYDETGTERILYAFRGKNTIVITTSSVALSELLGRLQR